MNQARTPPDFVPASVPRGTVKILADRCKGCGFCIEYCPKDVLAFAHGFNKKGYHPPEVIKDGECVNCNLCEMICPDFAIYSVPAADLEIGASTDSTSALIDDSTGEVH